MSVPRRRAVVVVAYGDPSLLGSALEPLRGEHVVVVDNSSAPETRTLVEGLGHTYLDAGGNRGFAGGVNVGLAHLAAQGGACDVLLLNPDARIEPDALDGVHRALLAEDDLAAVSPTVVGHDGVPHITWYPLPSPGHQWRFAVGLPRARRTRLFLMGACLMLRAEAIAEIGPFDERYFLYGEESDWQRRCFARGWRVAEVTGHTAAHLGGGSSDDSAVRLARQAAGEETHVRRWYGARGSILFRMAAWVAMVVRARAWPDAALRRRIQRTGPRRVAPLPPAPRPLAVLHLAVRPAQIDEVVAVQRSAGHRVEVTQPRGAAAAVASRDAWDVVHVHDLRSLAMARLTGPWHGARLAVDPALWDHPIGRCLGRGRVDLVVPAMAPDYRHLAPG